ncbi:MAG: hypothetical protein ACFB4I_05285 [Cyanophyceae cyanobacterium]
MKTLILVSALALTAVSVTAKEVKSEAVQPQRSQNSSWMWITGSGAALGAMAALGGKG